MEREISNVQRESARCTKNRAVLEWVDAAVSALVLIALLFTFFVRAATVDGSSMLPTLVDSERLLISSLPYHPHAGDIVIVDSYARYGKPLVKRVIATEGQTVDIDFMAGVVYVDGAPLEEPYTAEPTWLQETVEFPITVPDGCVFVMGDNRNHSTDSRSLMVGCIPKENILGKVLLRILPIQKFGVVQ